MLKKIGLMFCLSAVLIAGDVSLNNVKEWRDGFVTAYKAIQVETKIQGIDNKKIPVKKYIIYFDANRDKVSVWDGLMVQMFGYSSSIYKPIRATNDWIIFGSYDSKATAYQELKNLNLKIFQNSKKYYLKIFINDNKKSFYADKALLSSEIKALEKILKENNRKLLAKKKADLEAHQKIAIVYVDEKTHKVIDKKNNTKQKMKKTNPVKKGKIYKVKRKNSCVYGTANVNSDCLVQLKIGDRIRIVKKINKKWGLTSKNHYILMSSFKQNRKKEKLSVSKPVIEKKIIAVKSVEKSIATALSLMKEITVYKKTGKDKFSYFQKIKNDLNPIALSKMENVEYGEVYYKVLGKPYYIKDTDAIDIVNTVEK